MGVKCHKANFCGVFAVKRGRIIQWNPSIMDIPVTPPNQNMSWLVRCLYFDLGLYEVGIFWIPLYVRWQN